MRKVFNADNINRYNQLSTIRSYPGNSSTLTIIIKIWSRSRFTINPAIRLLSRWKPIKVGRNEISKSFGCMLLAARSRYSRWRRPNWNWRKRNKFVRPGHHDVMITWQTIQFYVKLFCWKFRNQDFKSDFRSFLTDISLSVIMLFHEKELLKIKLFRRFQLDIFLVSHLSHFIKAVSGAFFFVKRHLDADDLVTMTSSLWRHQSWHHLTRD